MIKQMKQTRSIARVKKGASSSLILFLCVLCEISASSVFPPFQTLRLG